MIRTRAVLATMSCLSVLALAACSGDDPEPKIAPTPSTSSPSEPGASANPSPDDTVKAWISARNQALRDGDLTEVLRLTVPDCNSCRGVLSPIRRVYDRGGSFNTDGWQIRGSKIREKSETRAVVDTGLEFAGGRTVPEAGADPVVYKGEKHIVVFKLVRRSDGWQVNFVGFLS